MSVEDCLGHKWIADESPERPLALEAPEVAADVSKDSPLVSSSSSMEDILTTPAEMSQDLEIKDSDEDNDHSSLQSFSDDQSEEGASNCSDKENSLGFNTVVTSSSSSASNSHSSTEVLFPDAPTTPKVLRKAPSETPPSVKALVKKFQVDSVKQNMAAENNSSNISVTSLTASPMAASPVTASVTVSPVLQQSACFVSQIPKLVNSPKTSSYATIGGSLRYSSSPRMMGAKSSLSTSNGSGGIAQRLSKGLEKRELTPPLLSSSSISTSSEQSSKGSPSSRYAKVPMACVICGEFVCRHQTTTSASTVPRKSLLGMEQRITC